MRGWSPITWIVLGLGLLALPVLWLTGDDGGAPTRRTPSSQASAPLQPLPNATPGSTPGSTPAVAAPSTAPAPPTGDVPAETAPRAYAAIVERPLFLPERHAIVAPPPPEPPPEVVEAAPEVIEPPPAETPTPRFRLVGTLVDGRGNSLAIVESADTGARTTLALGDAVEGWRLDSVGNGTIEVRLADQIVRLALGESP